MLRALYILLALGLMNCNQNKNIDSDSAAIPRPIAYPRPQLVDTTLTIADGLPLAFGRNAQTIIRTEVKPEGTSAADTIVWANITYPSYGATLHCTFIRPSTPADFQQVLSQRIQRMSLNLGDNTARRTEINSPLGVKSTLLTSISAEMTPVQFLSIGRQWIASGALSFNAPYSSADSILPYINAVEADIIRACSALHD